MRPLLVILGLLLAAAALWVAFVVGSQGLDPRSLESAPSATDLGGGSGKPTAALDAPVRPGSAPAGPGAVRSAVEIPEALLDPDRFELQGTLTVIDAEGVQHADQGGSFALEWGSWPDVHNREVRVEHGRFREFVPAGVLLEFSAFRIGGRMARIDQPRAAPDADGKLALVVRWGRSSTLTVVDHGNGAPLAGIEIAGGLRGGYLRDRLQIEIDPDTILLRGQSSPIALPANLGGGGATLWVGAAGYAWGRIDVDLFGGGAREIRLHAAGDLSVEVAGLSADTPALLRLHGGPLAPAPGALLTRSSRPDEAILLPRLPAGVYEVRIEVGEDPTAAELLAADSIEVLAGQSASLRLSIDPRGPADAAAPVSGLLHLPRAYRSARPALLIAALEGGNPSRSSQLRLELAGMQELGAELFAWSAGDLRPGRYLIEVVPLSIRQVLEVRPLGERDVRIEVPPPGELVVVPFDAQTGERVANAIVTWHATAPEGLSFWTTERVLADPRTRQAEIIAPAGELVINVNAPGFASAKVSARIESGRTGLSVPLERAVEATVVLFDGAARVPFGPGFHVDAAQLDGSGHVLSWKLVDGACRVALSQAGSYRFSLRVPAEFEAPPEQVAQVQADSASEISIHLVRR